MFPPDGTPVPQLISSFPAGVDAPAGIIDSTPIALKKIYPVNNLLAWWDPERGLNLEQEDEAFHLSSWADVIGSYTPANTLTNRPSWLANAYGGFPGVQFERSALQYLSLDRTGLGGLVANLNVYTIYAVVFTLSTTTNLCIYAEGNTGSSSPFMTLSINRDAAGGIRSDHRDDTGTVITTMGAAGVDINDGNLHLLVQQRIAADDWSLQLDGEEKQTGSNAPGTTTMNRLLIGARNVGGSVSHHGDHTLLHLSISSANDIPLRVPILMNYFGVTPP